jgi:ATP-binding cassette, subfamily B, bacterial PglK
MIATLRKCLLMVPPRLRLWWLLVPLMALIGGALEGGAAGSVFALVKILNDPTAIGGIPVVSRIAPHLPWQSPSAFVLQFTVLVGVYYVLKNLILVGMQYVRHKIQGESSAELACAMLRGYLLVPYPFHFRRNSAELIRNTTASVGAVFGTLEAANAILLEALVGTGIVAVLVVAAPGITAAAGVTLVLLIAVLLKVTRGMAQRKGREGHELGRTLYQTLQSALGGIKEIKALGREEFFYRAFSEVQRARLSLGYVGITMGVVPQLVIETAFVVGALLVVVLITVRGDAGPDVLPLVGLFAYAGFRMIPMANRLTWRLNDVRANRAPIEDLYDDHLLVTREAEADGNTGGAPIMFRDRLALEGVSYTYPGSEAPALSDVSLEIRRGESIGLVGPTGAGKSTLVDLIVGLLPPSVGQISVDGTSIVDRSRAWRLHIGYVPQSIFLLDDTLRRNIALGVPDAQIDEKVLRDAVRMAQIEALVDRLPESLDTMLGEHGIRLSGGERQRIGIARALYHDPDVLVFDEATSALDNVTEAEVTRAIENLYGEKTMLVIAHRLSTVRNCDRLVFLEDGRVKATGSYEQLASEEPAFARMAQASGG